MVVIKKLSPEPSIPPKPIDHVGMSLYRPLFFGTVLEQHKATKKKVNPAFADAEIAIPKPVKKSKSKKKNKVSKKKQPIRGSGNTYFVNLIDDYNKNVLSERKYRNDVVVRYYKHEPDQSKADTLVDYGFYLHERPVATERYSSLMSNVIYYGKDFPKHDLQLIVYLLISNGIEIKQVRKFKDFDGWKNKSIEIGGDPNLINANVMSLKEIKAIYSD